MTREAAIKTVMELPPQERLEVVMELWESIDMELVEFPMSDELKAELDRRMAAFEADPTSARPAEEVLRELEEEME